MVAGLISPGRGSSRHSAIKKGAIKCVRQSAVRAAAFTFILCLYIIKVMLNVCQSPHSTKLRITNEKNNLHNRKVN